MGDFGINNYFYLTKNISALLVHVRVKLEAVSKETK
jgi:hypothetical protein